MTTTTSVRMVEQKRDLLWRSHGTPCVGQFVCFVSFSQSRKSMFTWHGSISRARGLNFWPSARNWRMNSLTILMLRMGNIHRRQETKESDLVIIQWRPRQKMRANGRGARGTVVRKHPTNNSFAAHPTAKNRCAPIAGVAQGGGGVVIA